MMKALVVYRKRRAAKMARDIRCGCERRQGTSVAQRRARPWTTTTRCLVSFLLLLLASSSSSSSAASQSSVTVEPTPNRRQLSGWNNNSWNASEALVFAVVPKTMDNPFFQLVQDGCQDEAQRLSQELNRLVLCNFTGALQADDDNKGRRQQEIVLELLDNPRVAGIAVSVQDEVLMKDVFRLAHDQYAHKPMVTFDSDLTTQATHLRRAYIGTNNTFLGRELARAMLQLHPTVGRYAVLYSEDSPNMQERRMGFEQELHQRNPGWTQVEKSPADVQNSVVRSMQLMDDFAHTANVTSIVSLMGVPMRTIQGTSYRPWKDMYERHRDKGIQFLCGDAMAHQLDFLATGHVHALIGQMPYEFGTRSIQTLFQLVNGTNVDQEHRLTEESIGEAESEEDETLKGTNVLSHIFVPLDIPDYEVDENLIGNLRYVGFALFAIMAATSLALLHWTYNHRRVRVVQVAQPKFLGMVIIGVLIMSTCLIPLSMDDGGNPDNLGPKEAISICMTIPWVASIGFTTTFSALYAKTRRINKVFHSNSAFARVRVSEREVMMPFTILLFCNFVVLASWTILDPLTYERNAVVGADGWNRVMETYGSCQSDNAEHFLIPLIIVNIGVLVLSNWQAFEARHIEAEFSETKYIGICMASMLQAAVSGIPVLFVVGDNPKAFYLVLVFMIFIIGMGILLVIFVPKITFARLFMSRTEVEQRDFISFIIQKSSRVRNKKWGGGERDQGPMLGPPPGFAPRTAAAFESRWHSVAPAESNMTQLSSGNSQLGTSKLGQESLGESNRPEGVGTGQLLTPSAPIDHIPEEQNPELTENDDGAENRPSTNTGYSIPVNLKSTSSSTRGQNVSGEQRLFGSRSLEGKSGHTPTLYDSIHSFYSSTPHQSERSLYGHSFHHPEPMLPDDDPSKGMLVFRTMSVRADGSLAPSSMHSRNNRFLFEGDSDESFSTGAPYNTGPGALIGGDLSLRVPSSRNLNATNPASNQGRATTNSNGFRGLARTLSTGRNRGGLGRALSTGRIRGVSKTSSNGRRGLGPRLPSQLMRAILERHGENSQSSVSENAVEEEVVFTKERGSSLQSSLQSKSLHELNVIQEGDHGSDCDESMKSGDACREAVANGGGGAVAAAAACMPDTDGESPGLDKSDTKAAAEAVDFET